MKKDKSSPVTYWVACSGGVDSVVLVHLMHLSQQNFGILHMNFQLRGMASDLDEAFVAQLADELKVPFKTKKVAVEAYIKQHPKSNTQLAARNLRYQWFEEIRETEKATLLLAHHQDDQIETFFQQLARGGSVNGLVAMPQYKNGYLRPLLNHSKAELIALAKKNDWKWREDESNKKSDYERNWYRNEFLPKLATTSTTLSLITHYQHLLAWCQQWLKHLKTDDISIEISWKKWQSIPQILKQQILASFQVPIQHVGSIDRFSNSIKGSHLNLQKAILWQEGTTFVLKKYREKALVPPKLCVTNVPKSEWKLNPNQLQIDADKITGDLQVRTWQNGDRFQPLGMKKGSKLISDYLIDRKVSAHLKQEVLVLLDDKKIVGVIDFAPSELTKVDESTKTVLLITVGNRAEV